MLPFRSCFGQGVVPGHPVTPEAVEVNIFEPATGSGYSSQYLPDEYRIDAKDPTSCLHAQYSAIELQLSSLADGQRSMTRLLREILKDARNHNAAWDQSPSAEEEEGLREQNNVNGRQAPVPAVDLEVAEHASPPSLGIKGRLQLHRQTSPGRKGLPVLRSSSTMLSVAGPRSMPAGTKDEMIKKRRKLWGAVGQVQTSSVEQYREEGCPREMLLGTKFEAVSLCVIICNAIWIAVDTDMNKADVLVHAAVQYQVAENAFCAYYVVEWLIRFAAFKSVTAAFRDFWYVFDSLLVSMTVLEIWVMSLFILLTHQEDSTGIYSANVLKILRLFRLTRLSRVVRLLRSLPELLFMLHGVVAATRSVACTLGMLFGAVYVYGIAFTQLSKGTDFGEKYFKTVPASMYTLILDGAFMDSTKITMDAIRKESIFCACLFGLVILTANLTIMNLLIGVLCDVVTKVSAKEKEEMDYDLIKDKLSQILLVGGLGEKADDEQRISKDDFFNLVQNEQALELLEKAGVNTVVLLDFADSFFQSDKLGRKFERRITFEQFVELIMKLRQGNPAALRDVAELRKYVRDECLGLKVTLAIIKEGQQRLEAKLEK